jgi:hypothetical protein
LADVAAELTAGRATAQEFHEAFLAARVFCEAGEKPGFVAFGSPAAGLVPVFSSERELLRARGPVAWFATTGADVLGLLPEGYDVVLDMTGDSPLRLRPTALERGTKTEVGWG